MPWTRPTKEHWELIRRPAKNPAAVIHLREPCGLGIRRRHVVCERFARAGVPERVAGHGATNGVSYAATTPVGPFTQVTPQAKAG